jgi:hypothetical protein
MPTWLLAPLNWRVDDVEIIDFAIAPSGFLTWILARSRLPSSKGEPLSSGVEWLHARFPIR